MIVLFSVALAVALLVYVFWVREDVGGDQGLSRLARLREQKEVVYENLRDLNFEFRAGKLSEKDYYEMRDSLEQEAANLLAEIARLEEMEQGGVRV